MVRPMARVWDIVQLNIGEMQQRAILARPVIQPVFSIQQQYRTLNGLPQLCHFLNTNAHNGKVVSIVIVLPRKATVFMTHAAVQCQMVSLLPTQLRIGLLHPLIGGLKRVVSFRLSIRQTLRGLDPNSEFFSLALST